MQEQIVDAVDLGDSVIQNLSAWGLFLEADIVVKIVMVALIFASFWSWAIIFDKVHRLHKLRRKALGGSAMQPVCSSVLSGSWILRSVVRWKSSNGR